MIVFKEEIAKVEGIQSVFRVHPVRIIPPLRDSRTYDEESQAGEQKKNQEFYDVLKEACSRREELTGIASGSYNHKAQEINFFYEQQVRSFDCRS